VPRFNIASLFVCSFNIVERKTMQLSMKSVLGIVILALSVLAVPQSGSAGSPTVHRAVLVTGASSGIGLKITEKLAASGYHVYAGARKADDLERLNAEGIASFGAGQPEPDAVAAAVEHALFAESPKRRYMVTPDQEQARVTLKDAIRRVAELNQDHEFSYSRDELVKMMDEALDAL